MGGRDRPDRLTGNAARDPVAVDIPGTPDVDESILAVPMRFGDRVIGGIVLSQLGLDRFDEHDARLLEVMASVAAVAFENARLFRVERAAAQTARELLNLSQALTRAGDADEVLEVAFSAVPALLGTGRMAAWITDPPGNGLHLARHRGFHPALVAGWNNDAFGEVLTTLLGADGPVLLTPGPRGSVPPWIAEEDESLLIAPRRWEPNGRGVLVMVAAGGGTFGSLDVPVAGGIADMTSLALANAWRFRQLEEGLCLDHRGARQRAGSEGREHRRITPGPWPG